MKKTNIAIIGLGYVGLPLARLFATKYPVVGYDINAQLVADFKDVKDIANNGFLNKLSFLLNLRDFCSSNLFTDRVYIYQGLESN